MQGYAQQDPLVVYQKEATLMLDQLRFDIHKQVLDHFFMATVYTEDPNLQRRQFEFHKAVVEQMALDEEKGRRAAQATGAEGGESPAPKIQPIRRGPKVGRNDPCPCGSGKKFKKCCGAAVARATAARE
ncbi:SEC-C domain-containing protein [Candidatus Sumerlaeota bacterium]|nr:SEC-C domain-containing protein [Candidatus Sumerlaeota bacterium]